MHTLLLHHSALTASPKRSLPSSPLPFPGQMSWAIIDITDANFCTAKVKPTMPKYDFKGCNAPISIIWVAFQVLNFLFMYWVLPFTRLQSGHFMER